MANGFTPRPIGLANPFAGGQIPPPAPQTGQVPFVPQPIGMANPLAGNFQPRPIGPGGIPPGSVQLANQLQLDPSIRNQAGPITPDQLSPEQLSILQNDPGFRAALAQDPGFAQRQRDIQFPGQSATPFAGAFANQVQQANLDQSLIDQQAINLGLPGGVPPTGLIGSEIALAEGLAGGTQAIQEGTDIARGDITSALAGLQETLAQTGQQGQGLISQGAQQAQNILGQTRGQVGGIFDQAVAPSQQFVGAGQSAQQQNAALSGALGPEAQAAAFQAFQASPGVDFLRERGSRRTLREAAATGGLGGGRVQQALSEFNQGIALQDLARQQDVLGQLTGQGLTAAGNVGQLRGQQGGIVSQLGQAGAGIQQTAGLAGADLASRFGLAGAQAQQGAGATLANLASGAGFGIGQQRFGAGGALAAGRTRAGEAQAANIAGTTSALANLINQQGGGISDITGAAGGNLADLLAAAGQGQAGAQQQLAALLANLQTGQASQVAGLPGIPGVQQTQGILGGVGQLAGGVGGLLTGLNPPVAG